ncbi:MAG: DNA repair protein RadC [Firmicutes bacterium]|nr:DNA repair protein RadC [Bacillota bacterium]
MMTGIKTLPGSERPREKMIRSGAGSLSNAELLSIIINCGIKGESALSLASRVLAMDQDGLSGLMNCQPEELMKIKGIGEASACRICASAELGRRISAAAPVNRIRLDCPGAAAGAFMEDLRHLRKEVLCVAMINTKGEMIAKETVASGGLYSACANPREIFSTAVRKGAYAILLAHNHPSGDPSPSAEDISMTRQLAEAGKILGIVLEDHIIIGDGRYTSLKEMGIL